jgi:hypothetical protein
LKQEIGKYTKVLVSCLEEGTGYTNEPLAGRKISLYNHTRGMGMKDGNEDFELVQELIGVEEAQKLIKSFGGSFIYIPKNNIIIERHQSIKQEFCNGASYNELALKYGYTKNYIRRILHKRK